jgi:hypothetical protein
MLSDPSSRSFTKAIDQPIRLPSDGNLPLAGLMGGNDPLLLLRLFFFIFPFFFSSALQQMGLILSAVGFVEFYFLDKKKNS